MFGWKILGLQKCKVKKYFGPKKIMVQKNCGSKKFESEKYFELKIFGSPPLPYNIGLNKVGWIGRGVGGWDGGSIPCLQCSIHTKS